MMTMDIQTLSERILERLRNDIINGKYKPGEKITVKQIADTYGVGTVPVREAFIYLRCEKLLDWQAYKAAVVLPVDTKFIMDLRQVYAFIQADFIVQACENGFTQEDINTIEAMYQELCTYRGGDDSEEYMEKDRLFHRFMLEQAGNERALSLYDEFSTFSKALRLRYIVTPERMRCNHIEHGEIIRCLKTKDLEGLRKAILFHLEMFIHTITLEPDSVTDNARKN